MAVLAISSLLRHWIPMGLDDTPEGSGRRGPSCARCTDVAGTARSHAAPFRGDCRPDDPLDRVMIPVRRGLERAVDYNQRGRPASQCRPSARSRPTNEILTTGPAELSWPREGSPRGRDRGYPGEDIDEIGAVGEVSRSGPRRQSRTPMKITFVTMAPGLDGGTRTVAIYAGRLRDRGHEVQVVARLAAGPLGPPYPANRSSGAAAGPDDTSPDTTYLDQVGITPRFVDPPGPVTEADVPDADVVIATWWETAEWVARFPPSKGSKVYFIQDHEVFPYLPVERVAATWRLPLHKIVVSQWLADLARTTYGDEDASLVPNGVDRTALLGPSSRQESGADGRPALHPRPAQGMRAGPGGFRPGFPPVPRAAAGRVQLPMRRVPRLPLPPGPSSMSGRPRPSYARSMRSATPGCSAPGRKGSDCRSWRRWPAGRPSSPRPPAPPPNCSRRGAGSW